VRVLEQEQVIVRRPLEQAVLESVGVAVPDLAEPADPEGGRPLRHD
jgi:hypothetical protein